MSVCIKQTAASHPKFAFTPTFIFCSPICSNNCGVVFLWKYILVFEKWFFSFDRSNMQISTVNITRIVWPHVKNIPDLRYFCQHNPLFYHLWLIPCHYWSWQRNIYFLVNVFVWHTFPMSKSSIKTKTVLTMTDMTQSNARERSYVATGMNSFLNKAHSDIIQRPLKIFIPRASRFARLSEYSKFQ